MDSHDVANAHRAVAVPCNGCGASLPLDPGSAEVRCPHCQSVTLVDAQWRRSADAYRSDIDDLRNQEIVARRLAALHEQGGKYGGRIVRWAVPLGLLVAWWVIAVSSGIAAKLPIWANLAWVSLMVGAMLRIAQAMVLTVRSPDMKQMAAMACAQCSTCGGFVAFTEGKAVAACGYCRSTALKPSSLAQEFLELAATDEGRALGAAGEASDKAVAEVQRAAKIAGFGSDLGSAWVVVAIASAFALTAAVVVLLLSESSGEASPVGWITPTCLLGVALTVGWFVFGVRQIMRQNRALEAHLGIDLAAETRRANERAQAARG
ncbi:MAG: hypothetical protein GXP55_10440 [Deltaproteobacteria bacterium]|nr:hypothetical protein [Deltaproteobacteria bacterium]